LRDSTSDEAGSTEAQLVNRKSVRLLIALAVVSITYLGALGIFVFGNLVAAAPGALLTIRAVLALGGIALIYLLFLRKSVPLRIILTAEGLEAKYVRGRRRFGVDRIQRCEVVLDPLGGAVFLHNTDSATDALSALDEEVALRVADHLANLGVEILPIRHALRRHE
jgi:hypothetical protein